MNRSRFLAIAAAAVAAPVLAQASAGEPKAKSAMRTRKIPKSATGEAIPVIGMGTWSTFDVGEGAADRKPLAEVLSRFFAAGGRVIDSSPMYGRSESVTGDLVTAGSHDAWIATKVWTSGLDAGKAQIADSMKKLRTKKLDLLQVHNLLDWKTHLPEMRRMRDAGTVRYLGITHYSLGAIPELDAESRKKLMEALA